MVDWATAFSALADIGQFVPRWVSVLADATLKSLILLTVAGVVTLAMRSASAAARHAVWAMALGSVLLVPMLATVLPRWEMGIIPGVGIESGTTPVAAPTAVLAPGHANAGSVARATNGSSPSAAPRTRPNAVVAIQGGGGVVAPAMPQKVGMPVKRSMWSRLALPIVVVWGMGAFFVLGMLVTGLIKTSAIANTSTLVLESEWLSLSERLCRRLGIRRRVTLLRSHATRTPATWGVFQPIVLLPADSDHWSYGRRRDVLVHELAHVKRYDFLTQVIGRYACAVFWFNPFMWLAARQMRVERERACDDEVLLAGTKASTYAGHLLEIARSVQGYSIAGFTSVAMARGSQLSGRLLAILQDGRRRGPMSRVAATLACVVGLVLLLPLATMNTIKAQPPAVKPAQPMTASIAVAKAERPKPVIARSSLPTTQNRIRQVLQWASAPECHEVDGEGESKGISENSNDGNRVSRWWDGDCEGEVRLRGEVRFTPDFTDVASIPGGGRFSIEIDVNGDSRRIDIRPNGGTLTRRWLVNGRELPYEADAERWLPRALEDFFRHSSYDIDGRVDFFLANGGVSALLAQADRSHGQYLARRYYVAAIETGQLNPSQIDQVVRQATTQVTSDFEMARLLRAIPANDLRDTNLRRTYIQASNTIESDFEKARVLTELLQQDGLQPEIVQMLLASARDIESDFELARLLTTLGARYLNDPAARDAYLQAANSIESDFEKQRVLASLMEVDNLSSDNLRLLLTSARGIQSDYESARLLMGVVDKFIVDESLRTLFFQAVDGIESDYERQRVLTSLVERDGLSDDVVSDAIRSTTAISSDFAKASVLLSVATKYRDNAALRSQIEDAAETISSDHEYGRVMSAIRGRRTRR